jgi:hypothetical protein
MDDMPAWRCLQVFKEAVLEGEVEQHTRFCYLSRSKIPKLFSVRCDKKGIGQEVCAHSNHTKHHIQVFSKILLAFHAASLSTDLAAEILLPVE